MNDNPNSIPCPRVYSFAFNPSLAEPGHWLYICSATIPESVTTTQHHELLYVGCTTANSPIHRIGQHLNDRRDNPNSSLFANLGQERISPQTCDDLVFFVFGPLFPGSPDDGAPITKTLELALAETLRYNGHTVMGSHENHSQFCRACWQNVRRAFGDAFDLSRDAPILQEQPDYQCLAHS